LASLHCKMSATPIVLILGAGPRIGISVAKKFSSQGFKVAIVSRSGSGASTASAEGFLSLKADFTDPGSIPALFTAVEKEFYASPTVVVYNAGARTVPPIEDDMFSNSAENVVSDFNVNVLSAYVAAQQAVLGWKKLPTEAKKTFIYTGNIMNTVVIPIAAAMNLGIGKSASSYWIGLADKMYQGQGYR
jgi:NAD(P)-dependent dehydrogenase (short-subunit alcohol dehydrogenase family)